MDFQTDDYFELRWDRARRGEKRQRTPDRRLYKEEENFSSNVSFVLYFSVPLLINFPFHTLFFRHEQHVSLLLPLSVLSEIVISWNVQFFTKKITSRRNI